MVDDGGGGGLTAAGGAGHCLPALQGQVHQFDLVVDRCFGEGAVVAVQVAFKIGDPAAAVVVAEQAAGEGLVGGRLPWLN